MAKDSTFRKQLKEPDRFIRFLGELVSWGHRQMKPLLMGLVAVMVIALTWTLLHQMSARKEREASVMFEQTMAIYTKAATGGQAAAKPLLEPVKTEFSTFFDNYGKTRAAELALIVYGDLCYQAGDADTAISAYGKALEKVKQDAALRNILRSGLGYAYSLKKEYTEAIRYFEMIAADSDPTLRDDSLFNLAWLYRETGDSSKHAKVVDRMLTEFPETLYAALFKEQVEE
ncbi:tetratricopeptide repeat protein [Desulfosarcina sp. OttesenSCG-928-G17]|nr:tetratricopeptide repeat protein [Desulfosarcina sp. OttesenSCG-928-G17]